MTISSRLRLAAAVPAVLAAIITVALLLSGRALQTARETSRQTQEILSAVNEVNSLFHSYVLHHEERPKAQFLAQHEAIEKLLNQVRVRDAEERRLIDQIRRSGNSMRAAFLRLVESHERLSPMEEERTVSEAEERLVGQLSARARRIVSDALRLEALVSSRIASSHRNVTTLTLALILGATLALTLVLTAMMKNVASSLQQLTRGTEVVAAGNLNHVVKTPDADELGELARAFNRMTSQLRETTVSRDALKAEVEERKRAELALQEAQAKLQRHAEELERTVARRTAKLQETIDELEHFSYAIVHDLRAPLRAMQGFAGLIEEEWGANGNSQIMKEYLRRIRAASNRMDQLITDALSYSKAAYGDFGLEPVDLHELVNDLVDTYPNLQRDRLELVLEERLPVVLGNGSALTQCLSNLLGNAVKFSKSGVKPRVRLWTEDCTLGPDLGAARPNRVRIWIEDNGIGIPKDSQRLIFGMFQRAHSEYEGTGIGLAIVRKVVQRMGGEVGVESEEGKGSRFWVILRRPN